MIFHSAFQYPYLWLPLIGFIIGFFASLLGSGGGFFFLPALILFYNIPAQVAVATSLAATLPICVVGSIGHIKNRHVHMRLGLIFAVAGFFGALAGAGFSSLVSSSQLKVGFGIYSVLIAMQIIISGWKEKKARAKEGKGKPAPQKKYIKRSSFYGFFAGIITGAFGTSGAAPVLAGLLSMRIPLKVVAGTSLLIITVTTLSALAAHFVIGKIDLTLVYFLTAGTVLGAVSGPKYLARIKTENVEGSARVWYASGLFVFGVLMITINYS